ncbi:MAG: hypothetical protein E7284_07105 [Lachnospiraceae bacterium]|nr:hypothetical protein [Lachnospiraceae bacterium]
MNSKKKLIWQLGIGIIISVGITLYLALTSFIPTGNDIFGHLYKAEILYDNLKQWNLYPLYTTEWYNGIQLFRYWPIFTYYIIAFINFLTRDIFIAYYVYVGLTFFVSYLGFVLIANRENKGIFILIGIVYWFLPDCLRVLFGEGNLSRVMIYALLPLFFYFYTNLIEHKKHFVITSLLVALLVSTHFMLAAMCAIIFTIYGFFKGLKNKTQWYGFFAFVTGILIAGILLLPGLSGGLVSDSSSAAVDTIEDWSQPLYLSLSPFNRLRDDINCSFGLGVLIMGIAGLIVAKRNKDEKSGIIVGLIFFILSDTIFTEVFKQLPLSQVFWMSRFVQMCYILILYDFARLNWKPYWKYAVVGVAVLDLIPSLAFFNVKSDLAYQENTYLLESGVEITQNRLGLVDESLYGSYPSYYALKTDTPYIQGWAIQGAKTSENIITMTESIQQGYYGYTFHQLLGMGADSVIVKKTFVKDTERFIQTAEEYGYVLVQESSDSYLFDLEGVEGSFGVKSQYNSLAIGSSSIYISYLYPGFEQGYSDCLTDYSIEELLQYDKIYLSNFEYDDVEHAEEIVQKLSDSGVEIFIDCTHMPINVLSISEFLGVESRFLSISEFDTLYYGDMEVDIEIPYEWYSTYLLQVDDVEMERHSYQYGEQTIDYLIKRDNITFVGFNLVYLYYDTPNEELLAILDEIFDIEDADRRIAEEIVPIEVEYGINRITIHTDEKVNTTIAFQDNFRSDRDIYERDNMLVVDEGTTVIKIYYKHFVLGLLCTLTGIGFMIILNKRMKKEQEVKG